MIANLISLFTGSGQLDLAIKEALLSIGIESRTICYVEKDTNSQRILRARIKDGLLEDAPIVADVRDGKLRSYRGYVGGIVAGFPCQPFSFAGKRDGEADARYLFPDVIDLAVAVGCGLLFLENVAGILSPKRIKGDGSEVDEGVDDGADVVVLPAPIGDVARIMAESGFHAGWIPLAAEDVGAPHGRERWWSVAWNPLAYAEYHGLAGSAKP